LSDMLATTDSSLRRHAWRFYFSENGSYFTTIDFVSSNACLIKSSSSGSNLTIWSSDGMGYGYGSGSILG